MCLSQRGIASGAGSAALRLAAPISAKAFSAGQHRLPEHLRNRYGDPTSRTEGRH